MLFILVFFAYVQKTMTIRRLHSSDTLLLASANKGKLVELRALLSPYGISLESIAQYFDGELAEDGDTFEANALQKAHFASKLSGLPALADDSGFCVAALDGAPGIYSARWAGETKDFQSAMRRVHAEVPADAIRDAYFVCVLALCFPDGSAQCFRGEVHGNFCWPPLGDQGFGYDPIFIPKGDNRTFGQMPGHEKDLISHRAAAFAKFQREALPQVSS